MIVFFKKEVGTNSLMDLKIKIRQKYLRKGSCISDKKEIN
jgi:hypothetical protein